jgi:hypothetical protein
MYVEELSILIPVVPQLNVSLDALRRSSPSKYNFRFLPIALNLI